LKVDSASENRLSRATGLAALMAWPVLGHMPTAAEAAGLVAVVAGLILAVTTTSRSTA
jgi:hypothetical protein